MIYDVLIYGEDETEYTSEGLCGALEALKCVCVEEAGGTYEVQLDVAYDAWGKWQSVQAGRTVKCWVQRRGENGAVEIAPELFDIYQITWDDAQLTAYARHVSYRLMQNVTRFTPSGQVTLSDCVNGIMGGCLKGSPVRVTASGGRARTVPEGWMYVNPVDALLDPETGCAALFGAQVERRGFAIDLRPGIGVDRGVIIEPGHNLAGVTVDADMNELATHLVPLGTDASGNIIMLPETYVTGEHADDYGRSYVYAFQADGAQVSDTMTLAQCYTEMREQARAMLDAGCDVPTLTVTVDVQQVETAADAGVPVAIQRAIIAQLEPMPVYDLVTVRTAQGLEVQAQVVRREWDCLHARLEAVELGTTAGGLSGVTFASWQVPSGISGGKLAVGSVPGSAIAPGSVSAAQMGAGGMAEVATAAAAIVETGLDARISAQAWPIGSVYRTTEAADPGDTIGGTWASLGSESSGGATVYVWERLT